MLATQTSTFMEQETNQILPPIQHPSSRKRNIFITLGTLAVIFSVILIYFYSESILIKYENHSYAWGTSSYAICKNGRFIKDNNLLGYLDKPLLNKIKVEFGKLSIKKTSFYDTPGATDSAGYEKLEYNNMPYRKYVSTARLGELRTLLTNIDRNLNKKTFVIKVSERETIKQNEVPEWKYDNIFSLAQNPCSADKVYDKYNCTVEDHGELKKEVSDEQAELLGSILNENEPIVDQKKVQDTPKYFTNSSEDNLIYRMKYPTAYISHIIEFTKIYKASEIINEEKVNIKELFKIGELSFTAEDDGYAIYDYYPKISNHWIYHPVDENNYRIYYIDQKTTDYGVKLKNTDNFCKSSVPDTGNIPTLNDIDL